MNHNLTFIANVEGPIENKSLAGRDYWVVPVVLLTEGVYNGNKGPKFYPGPHLSKSAPSWNNKPCIIYHPPEGTSGSDPLVLNSSGVGKLLNTKWDDTVKKLRSQAWVEKTRSMIDNRVYTTLSKNLTMEVSTGMSAHDDGIAGIHNGISYTGTISDIVPDHLAFLPDMVGACSVNDGCGLNITNCAGGMRPGGKCTCGKCQLVDAVNNELSHDSVGYALRRALRTLYNPENPDMVSVYIVDVFDDFFIFERDGLLYKLGYTSSLNVVTISKEPVKVVRVVDYQIANTANSKDQYKPVGDTQVPTPAEIQAARKTTIDNLITNAANQWAEKDRPFLDALNDDQLSKIVGAGQVQNTGQQTQTTTTTATLTAVNNPPITGQVPILNGQQVIPFWLQSQPERVQGSIPAQVALGNTQQVPAQIPANMIPRMTLEQFAAFVPTELQGQFSDMMVTNAVEKDALIKRIMGQPGCMFNEAYLQTLQNTMLRGIASLCTQPQVQYIPQQVQIPVLNYGGQGTVPTNIVTNTQHKEEPLLMPTSFSMDEYKNARKVAG